MIADRHGATKLKEKALKMIVEKKEQVENFDDWCKFIGPPSKAYSIFVGTLCRLKN